jgi:hypothetical protein
MHKLYKPITYALIFGLLGCTGTRWTTVENSTGKSSIPLARITLRDGEILELRDVKVDSTQVSGIHNNEASDRYEAGDPYAVQVDLVLSIEEGERIDDTGKAIGLIGLALITIAVYGLATMDCCFTEGK